MSKVLAETTADENTSRALAQRRAERAALLARITQTLEGDDRIAAAWLFGSIGRGEADDLSDLDLRVVVSNEYVEGICANRQAYAAQVGEAVLFQEAPQNRPVGGAFLLTLYAGEFGPQEVDWTWQPLSGACLWPNTRILLNRVGLSSQGEMPWGYQPRPAQTPLEEAVQRVSSFWAMLLIIAKYAARSPWEDSMGLIGMSVQPLHEVSEYLGLTPRYVMENLPPHVRPQEKVRLLRGLADEMEALMPAVEARGGHVPGLPCRTRAAFWTWWGRSRRAKQCPRTAFKPSKPNISIRGPKCIGHSDHSRP